MTVELYRPWGQFQWLLNRYAASSWDLIGCLSTEDRCLAVRDVLHDRRGLRNVYLGQIGDDDSLYREVIEEKLEKRMQTLIASGGAKEDVRKHRLFESPDIVISAIKAFLEESEGNIIIDISSFPKRFFFIIIKILLQNSRTKNLIATYTIPAQYRAGELAENFEPWRPLPTFSGQSADTPIQVFFVGVGHITMGLPEQLESASGSLKIQIFIPFPGHPQSIKRNWQFVQTIEQALPGKIIPRRIIPARDVSECFNHILVDTNCGQREALLAPFGPKPLSLAMCLYACKAEHSRVYYTQPRVYPPDYSLGIGTIGGVPKIYGYCIRINGEDQYTIPNQ